MGTARVARPATDRPYVAAIRPVSTYNMPCFGRPFVDN